MGSCMFVRLDKDTQPSRSWLLAQARFWSRQKLLYNPQRFGKVMEQLYRG